MTCILHLHNYITDSPGRDRQAQGGTHDAKKHAGAENGAATKVKFCAEQIHSYSKFPP